MFTYETPLVEQEYFFVFDTPIPDNQQFNTLAWFIEPVFDCFHAKIAVSYIPANREPLRIEASSIYYTIKEYRKQLYTETKKCYIIPTPLMFPIKQTARGLHSVNNIDHVITFIDDCFTPHILQASYHNNDFIQDINCTKTRIIRNFEEVLLVKTNNTIH